jgi:hypothetical protein
VQVSVAVHGAIVAHGFGKVKEGDGIPGKGIKGKNDNKSAPKS